MELNIYKDCKFRIGEYYALIGCPFIGNGIIKITGLRTRDYLVRNRVETSIVVSYEVICGLVGDGNGCEFENESVFASSLHRIEMD